MGKPGRKVKVGRKKTAAISIAVLPSVKQDFYDLADAKGMTLTAVFEEMLAAAKKRYLSKVKKGDCGEKEIDDSTSY